MKKPKVHYTMPVMDLEPWCSKRQGRNMITTTRPSEVTCKQCIKQSRVCADVHRDMKQGMER